MIIINFLKPLQEAVGAMFEDITAISNVQQKKTLLGTFLNTQLIHVILSSVMIEYQINSQTLFKQEIFIF